MKVAPLWITYAWVDNVEGDFDYLVQRLNEKGIPSLYDRIALVPGRRLWDQIAVKISTEPLSGWAYLITPNSLSSEACKEELSYALQRALETKGREFPLVGLLHQVSIRDVPLALRVRLCINLANPDWTEEVRATVLGEPPHRAPEPQTGPIVKIHRPDRMGPNSTAVEIRPRFGELTYWRIAYPADYPQPTRWGSGPANGGGISGVRYNSIEGESIIKGKRMKFVGAGNTLTPSTSAYIVFNGPGPEQVYFWVSNEPVGTDMGELLEIRLQ